VEVEREARSSPRAERAMLARSTIAAVLAALGSPPVTPLAFSFTASARLALRGDRLGDRARIVTPTHPYTRTRSRTGPPSRRYTGTSSARPAMSHKRLVDAGHRGGQHRAAPVEGTLGQHLPVVLDGPGPVRSGYSENVPRSQRARPRSLPPGSPRPNRSPDVGADADEQPARRHQGRCRSSRIRMAEIQSSY